MTTEEKNTKAQDTELVHFKWNRFKSIVAAQMKLVDQELEANPGDLEQVTGAVMDALDYILYHRGRLHHSLSRKARRHGIDPAKFGWGFSKRTGLSDVEADVEKLLEPKE